MPTYEYLCEKCQLVMDRLELPGDEFDAPPECPECDGDTKRVVMTPPQVRFVGPFSAGTPKSALAHPDGDKPEYYEKGLTNDFARNREYKEKAAEEAENAFIEKELRSYDL